MKKIIFIILIIIIVLVIAFVGVDFLLNSKPTGTIPTTKSETTETDTGETDREIKVLSSGETIGYFEGIEWGDYCHFNVKDLNGEMHGFFVYKNFSRKIDIEEYGNDPVHKGKKVKVKWQDIETYIPEGGGNFTIRELLDVEELE